MTFFKTHVRLSIFTFGMILTTIGLLTGLNLRIAPAQSQVAIQPSPPEPTVVPTETVVTIAETVPASPPPSLADVGEPTPEAFPGAVAISMFSGADFLLFPADSTKPRAEQSEWRYVPQFRINAAKYDQEEKILTCTIDARLSEQTKQRIHEQLRKLTGGPIQTEFRLNPVRLQSLTVELTHFGKKYTIEEVHSSHDIANGAIPIAYEVTDEKLHRWLTNNLNQSKIAVRALHPYAAFTRNSLQVESSLTAVRDALEKVLPKGMKLEDLDKHPLIVSRESMIHLQTALREEFRVRIEGNQSKLSGLNHVLEKMLNRITVSELPLSEATREMIDSCLVYNSKTATFELSPSERTTTTKELKENSYKRTSFKHAWDTMRDLAKKDFDHKTWHKQLIAKMHLNASLEVGVGIYSGSASLDLSKEIDNTDDGSDQKLREIHQQFKNAGEVNRETEEKYSKDFKGDDFAKSVAGKILNLQRVTDLNLSSFKSAIIEHNERISKGMLERVTLLQLEATSTQEADVLFQLEQNRKQQAADKAFFVKQFAKMQSELTNAKSKHTSDQKALKTELTDEIQQNREVTQRLNNRLTRLEKSLEAFANAGHIGTTHSFDLATTYKAESDGVIVAGVHGSGPVGYVASVSIAIDGHVAAHQFDKNGFWGTATAVIKRGQSYSVNTCNTDGVLKTPGDNATVFLKFTAINPLILAPITDLKAPTRP